MSLADTLTDAQKARRGPGCSLGLLLPLLDDRDRDGLLEALSSALVESTAIARSLQAHGHDISSQTVSRHRRHVCKCP